MRIFDPNGIWITNTSQFLMHDPESNTIYPSNEPIKVTATAWLETQPVLKKIADPTKPEGPPNVTLTTRDLKKPSKASAQALG